MRAPDLGGRHRAKLRLRALQLLARGLEELRLARLRLQLQQVEVQVQLPLWLVQLQVACRHLVAVQRQAAAAHTGLWASNLALSQAAVAVDLRAKR